MSLDNGKCIKEQLWVNYRNSGKKKKNQISSLKCEICDKEFKKNNGLKYHVYKIHNLEKVHQCNICQKFFDIEKNLTSHIKIVHENKKRHTCDSCTSKASCPKKGEWIFSIPDSVCMYVALNGAVPLHQPASELDFSLSELATRIKRELTYYYVLSHIH